MAMKKKTLFKILGGALLTACSTGIISAVIFAKNIEENYAPQFDANEFAQTEEILKVTAQAREAERNAIYDECKEIAMNSDAVKKLQHELDSLMAICTLPMKSMQIAHPDFSVVSFDNKKAILENKIDEEIEKTINETPVMRELNDRYHKYSTKRLYLSVAGKEYNEWKKLPRKERIKQNLERRQEQRMEIGTRLYCNYKKIH